MADADETNENPLDAIRSRADEMGLEGDERDDYIQGRMARAGFKKGPGEWIRPEDDDEEKDDDDEPMTRGDWRRMQRENRRKSVTNSGTGGAKKVQPKEKGEQSGGKAKTRKDPWW